MEKELLDNFIREAKEISIGFNNINKVVKFIFDNDFSTDDIERVYVEVGDNGKSRETMFRNIVHNILSCQPLRPGSDIVKKLAKYVDEGSESSMFSLKTSPSSLILRSNFRYDSAREILLNSIEKMYTSYVSNSEGIFVWVYPGQINAISESVVRVQTYSIGDFRSQWFSRGENLFIPYDSILNLKFSPSPVIKGKNLSNSVRGDVIYRIKNVKKIDNLLWRRLEV